MNIQKVNYLKSFNAVYQNKKSFIPKWIRYQKNMYLECSCIWVFARCSKFWRISSVGRAHGLWPWSREFEPPILHSTIKVSLVKILENIWLGFFIFLKKFRIVFLNIFDLLYFKNFYDKRIYCLKCFETNLLKNMNTDYFHHHHHF